MSPDMIVWNARRSAGLLDARGEPRGGLLGAWDWWVGLTVEHPWWTGAVLAVVLVVLVVGATFVGNPGRQRP